MALNQIISEGIKDGEVKAADIAVDAVGITDLSATGTASSSTFLRGDNAWATPTDTNTTYTAGTGITLSSTEFSLTDNGVTLAKMAGLARGKIIYGDSSGDPAVLAAGTANYVLTSDGTDISWAAAAGGGAVGGSTDKIFMENGQTVTTNYTIGTEFGAACNALSAGPITINSGITVTIDSGDYWTIV